MRLKEDSDSWKSSGIIKRDFRNDHSDSFSRKKSSKKDTKRWCKGKVGVEHEYKLVESGKISRLYWKTHKCINCGKKDFEFS